MRPFQRTSDFHSDDSGSNPDGDAMNHSCLPVGGSCPVPEERSDDWYRANLRFMAQPDKPIDFFIYTVSAVYKTASLFFDST